MKSIVMNNICKRYGKVNVVRDLCMNVRSGEKLILLGPSGCGKSTILRMIAGLEDITSGDLFLGGRRVNDMDCGGRNVAMVFQNYALFPHMTVEQNITYGLRINKLPVSEIAHRKNEVVKMLGLDGLEARRPRELSGGQRQRVALARAVSRNADFLLLDEPLSNLDAQLREHARKELVKVHEKFGQTMVYVTHDQTEAMTVGDKIALLSGGVIQMFDTPFNVYNRPANIFTAKFIGSPSCNIIPAKLESGGIVLGEQAFAPGKGWRKLLAGRREVYFGIRPEHVCLGDTPCPNALRGRVRSFENYGHRMSFCVEAGGVEFIVAGEGLYFPVGSEAYLSFDPQRIHLFDRETEMNSGYPENVLECVGNESVYQYNVA